MHIQKPNTQATGHRVVHMLAPRDSKHTQSPGYQPTQPRGGRVAPTPVTPCHLLAEQQRRGEHRTQTPRTCTMLANTAHGGAKGMGKSPCNHGTVPQAAIF